MEYILIPSESKAETTFLLNLLKKMQKEASIFSSQELEETLFLSALKDADGNKLGSLEQTKTHLKKVAAGK